MTVSKVSSEQLARTSFTAALRMEFSNSSVKRFRKELSSVEEKLWMLEMLVMLLGAERSTGRCC